MHAVRADTFGPMVRSIVLCATLAALPALGQTSKAAVKAREALDANKPYRALKLCNKELGKKIPDAACYALRAEAHNRIGEPREALLDARQGMKVPGPTAVGAQEQLGIAYHAIGMRDSAEHAFRNLLDVSIESKYRLALVLRETGRQEAALDMMNEAIAGSNSARNYRERGVTHALLNDSSAARADLDKAVELDPDNPVQWNTRGYYAYAVFGAHQRAIADYDKAIKLDKNHGYAFNNRGWSRYKLGNVEAGLRDIRLAGRKNPSNAMVDRNLGVIAHEQGKTQLACTLWRQAIDKDFTMRFGNEVEELVRQHCGKTTSPAPQDMQDRNAPTAPATPNAPSKKRGNAP